MTNPLTREERRELAIDTIASWALEGMHPSADTLADIQAFVEGRITTQELIEMTKNGAYRAG